jgi:hypothetical protein
VLISRAAILAVSALFIGLHFPHILADYPNHSPWLDWAKYTDEGWYGGGALRYVRLGSWYLPGEFNAGAALPVLPLLEVVPFLLFGATMAVARYCTLAIFILICAASWLLLNHWRHNDNSAAISGNLKLSDNLAPELAVLFLAVSPFVYVNSRLAILEPPLILWMLLSLLLVSALTPARRIQTQVWKLLALGVLCATMVLTKTTAISLMPSIAYLMWSRASSISEPRRTQLATFVRWSLIAVCGVAAVFIPYGIVVAHLHLAADVTNYFRPATYTVRPSRAFMVAVGTLFNLRWMGGCFGPLCCVAAFVALAKNGRHPLVATFLLWAAGYLGFIWYHANMQPRYYFVAAIPLLLLLAIVVGSFLDVSQDSPRQVKLRATAVASLVLVFSAIEATQTVDFVLHPEYTFLNAATRIHQIIAGDPMHSNLLLSSSGEDIMLMTGTPGITDGISLLPMKPLVQRYDPGWLALWAGPDEANKTPPLRTIYALHEAGRFEVMDVPSRNPLILYRLDRKDDGPAPANSSTP